jgi:uncharacterized protein YndB with AHSA1/START domain
MIPAMIAKQIQIQAPAARVWQFIGTEEGLRQWWQAEVTLEGKKGGCFSERGLRDGKLYRLDGVVAVYDPPHQLMLLLQPASPHPDGAAPMSITITLEESEGQTNVRVVHQMAIALPAAQPQRLAEPLIGRPAGDLPVILNQWPVHQRPADATTKMPDRSHANDVTPLAVDLPGHYEDWWARRMMVLLQLFN